MVEWLALVISVVALIVAAISAAYSRREAVATEDSNWLSHPLRFDVSVENPHSGSARLLLVYIEGMPLDEVTVTLLVDDTSPAGGFGVGNVESTTWSIGPLHVGQRVEKGLVQLLGPHADGPPWRDGESNLRALCRRGRHTREVALVAGFPPQPWVY